MFVSPMLLHKAEFPFDDDNWLSELKLDGIRFLYSTMGDIKFFSRHNNEVTDLFPELMKKLIPRGMILDGEIVSTGTDGRHVFEKVLSRFQVSDSKRIPILAKIKPVMQSLDSKSGKSILNWDRIFLYLIQKPDRDLSSAGYLYRGWL